MNIFQSHFRTNNAASYAVRVGSSYRSRLGTLINVKRIFQHEKYDARNTDFDFNLLELEKTLEFNEKIQPIALPDEGIVIEDGTNCLVSGWGKTK